MDSANQAALLDTPIRPSSFWPEKLLGRRPGLKEINVLCWALFVAFLLVPICVISYLQAKRGTISVTQLHSDFVYFYGDGEIARHYPAARIYDYGLQLKVFNSIYPAHSGVYGPSPYPPYVPLFFEPFTYFSFRAAYFVWLVVSLTLYLAGIYATLVAVYPGERYKWSIAICLALSYLPFLFGTLLNGQLASIAAFSVGVAIYQDKRGRPFYSGLAMALLTYKVTLLLLILPMLLLTRRFRTLSGFTAGTGGLAAIATCFAGIGIWPAYFNMLRIFGRISGLGGASRMTLWNHVDLKSFFAAMLGERSVIGSTVLFLLALGGIFALGFLFLKAANRNRPIQWLVWGTALTWTLLLNVYVPIYDSILVFFAILLTLGALRDLEWRHALEWVTFAAIILFLVSWETESFAKAHRIQWLTVMLMVIGLLQIYFLASAVRLRPKDGLPSHY